MRDNSYEGQNRLDIKHLPDSDNRNIPVMTEPEVQVVFESRFGRVDTIVQAHRVFFTNGGQER